MFIPEMQLAKYLMKERLKEAEQQRLVKTALLAAKNNQRTWSSRLMTRIGDRLVDLGSYLQLRACSCSPNTSARPAECLAQA